MSGNNYRMLTIVILYEAQIILGSSNCLQTPNLSADISVYPRDFKRSAHSSTLQVSTITPIVFNINNYPKVLCD